jgi:hypothetical protein
MTGFLKQSRSFAAARKLDVIEQSAARVGSMGRFIDWYVEDEVEVVAADRDISITHTDRVGLEGLAEKKKPYAEVPTLRDDSCGKRHACTSPVLFEAGFPAPCGERFGP